MAVDMSIIGNRVSAIDEYLYGTKVLSSWYKGDFLYEYTVEGKKIRTYPVGNSFNFFISPRYYKKLSDSFPAGYADTRFEWDDRILVNGEPTDDLSCTLGGDKIVTVNKIICEYIDTSRRGMAFEVIPASGYVKAKDLYMVGDVKDNGNFICSFKVPLVTEPFDTTTITSSATSKSFSVEITENTGLPLEGNVTISNLMYCWTELSS